MAGTLPGIANTQRVDQQGRPLVGGKLYLFNAGTITPATAYKDFNLTAGQEYPPIIELDSWGRIPPFYLADGFYRARLTNASGSTVVFDELQLPAVGASDSGGGGGGTTVDPTTIFGTGDFDWQPRAGSRTGWARANGRTIGNASSGATERANDDCEALFLFNYNTYSNAQCPVVGGRGASAAADWAAGKQLTLLDLRFIMPIGLDDMGNTAAGRAANVPTTSGSATAAASVIGETLNTLTEAKLPALTKTLNITTATGTTTAQKFSASFNADVNNSESTLPAPNNSTNTTGTVSISVGGNVSFGGGGAHNNTPLAMTGTYYQKL